MSSLIGGKQPMMTEASPGDAPTDALIRDGANWAVFRIEHGRARLTPVRAGTGDDRYRAILKGLASGDRVILFPGVTLRDGARVRASATVRVHR